jgi:thiol:disulfide interchange protein DsbD
MTTLRLIIALLMLTFAHAGLAAESQPSVTKRATVSLVSDTDAVAAGTPYHLGLRFRLAPGWHTYGRDPGDAGIPPDLAWTLPEGTKTGEIVWPATETFKEGPLTTYGYTGDAMLVIPATGPGPVQVHASWLVCNNICVPEEADFRLDLPLGTPAPSAQASLFQAPVVAQSTALWRVIGAALLGGLILNLMPCVFPVLAMKAMAIARLSSEARSVARAHALGYAAGVVLSFAAVGGAVLGLRSLGHAAGWGFQFQSPVFVAVIGWVLFAVGLNLSGVFEIGGSVVGAGQSLTLRRGFIGSFFSGALAVLVATPCTAPFMSVALAAALTAAPVEVLLIFAALGVGLAAPIVALELLPGVARLIPRPGRWMIVFKQALAFPMYAAAAWLAWVISQQAGADGVLAMAGGMVLIGLAAWAFGLGRWGRGVAIAAVVAAGFMLTTVSTAPAAIEQANAERFTAARLASLRAEGKPVFVNLTAAWCVTCLVNERVALAPAEVQRAFDRLGVARLTGDWTRQDPEISAFLQAQGRDGVPLYLYYPAGGKPVRVLPQILTPSSVLAALAS